MTQITDNLTQTQPEEKPGAQLASLREARGYTIDFVAAKLHLRSRIIELLEQDHYDAMPEPVFIKGYFRAYAKLLEIEAAPFIQQFEALYVPERKQDKMLWQNQRETTGAERLIRVITFVIAVGVSAAVAVWWYNNQEDLIKLPPRASLEHIQQPEELVNQQIKLTDLSKMKEILTLETPASEMSTLEKAGE